MRYRLLLSRLAFAVALLAAIPLVIVAQTTVATHISTGGALPTNCRVGDVFYKTGASAGLYNATAVGPCTWTLVAAGTVGNNFFAVTGPTTTTKTFTFPNANATVLTDASVVTTAQGGTGLGSAADDNALIGNGTIWQSKALTNCAASNEAVTYDTASNAFGCQTITGGGGGGVGDVTHTGSLTSGKVVIGNGSADVTVAATSGLASLSSGTLSAYAGSSCSTGATVTSISSTGVVTCIQPQMVGPLETHTASSSAQLDFTTCFSSTYDVYQFRLYHVLPATDNVQLAMRFSYDGGSTYASAASSYFYGLYYHSNQPASGAQNDANYSSTYIILATNADNGSGTNLGGVRGEINLYNPMAATFHTYDHRLHWWNNDGRIYIWDLVGWDNQSTNAIGGVRFLFSSGNIASGTIACYGLNK